MTTPKRPTVKALGRWWDDQPAGLYTCGGCGRVDVKSYVQPQHPFYRGKDGPEALCGDCIGKRVEAARKARKKALAEEPRCEVQGCRRRGNWRALGALFCGRHLKRARSKLAKMGTVGILVGPTLTREAVLSLAGSLDNPQDS